MTDYTFRPAKRENVSLIIGLAGPSGSGKTYSAMRLAAGIVGPGERFAVIDTEAGRAKHYADLFAFDHLDLAPPFRPDAYAEAIKAADAAGYKAIVVDSMSHEWAGEGGILDWQDEELDRMAGTDWKKRESCKMAAWIKPKMSHKQMVQRLLQVRAHLLLCFRAEEKIEMVRDEETRKIKIEKKKGLTGLDGWFPICEKSLPFELTASFLLLPDRPGYIHPLKLQEQHKAAFRLDQPLDEEAGKLVREWSAGGAAPAELEALTATKLLEQNKQNAPTAMPEGSVLDWLAAIEGAATVPELQKHFAGAIEACAKVKDKAAQARFVAAKDKRKAALSAVPT